MKLDFDDLEEQQPAPRQIPRPQQSAAPGTGGGKEQEDGKKRKGRKAGKAKGRSLPVRLFCWLLGLLFTATIIGASAVALLFLWVSRDLPDLDGIMNFQAAQATTVYARDGSVLGTICHEKRFVITLDDMPKYLPMAFLAIEDSSFYEHPGINPLAIVRAMLVNIERGTKSQGGSTITQQLVKQLLLTSERSYTRKMKEAILATRLERSCTKDQILTLYLNYIYLGQHSYGVEAAARTYFGKHAANITLAEAALIAGMPQAPSRYNPFRHPDTAKQRQMEVLGRLRHLSWITDEEYDRAASEPLVYWSMPDSIGGPAQWYFEEARRLLIEFFTEPTLKALGVETTRYGEDFVYEAGLTVQTAMDPTQQQLAGEALRSGLEGVDKRQGWRGPVKHLATAEERQSFLKKKTFDTADFMDGQWTQALVTKATANGAQVALGGGYVGTIAPADMSWAKHMSTFAHSKAVKTIVSEGDVVWVNRKPHKAAPDKGKAKPKAGGKGKAAGPEEPVDDGTIRPGRPVALRLQQEPLVQGAIVSIEPDTGDVVALIGGYQFGNSHFNRATQARRQPGSSFKPIVYSTALDNGFTPTSTVLDAPFEYVDRYTHKVWRPSNFENSYRGEMALYEALIQSRNVPTVRLTQAVGVDKVIERAKILGLEPEFPRVLPIALGSVAVSPLNLTQAYAAFANKGLGVRPRIITSIKDAKGRELYRQDIEHWQAISPQNAYQMSMLLKRVVERGTGSRARIEGRNICGKTGTTNDVHDVWFVGYTPYLCTGVYIGYDELHPLGRQEQGGRTAAPIFRNYRLKADAAYDSAPQDFEQPEGIVMVDGLAFVGEATPGLSATEGATPGQPVIVDTSQEGEDLLQEMF